MKDSYKGIHGYGMHQIVAGAEYLYRAQPTISVDIALATFHKSIVRINSLIKDLYIGLDSPVDLARDLRVCEVALSTYSLAVDKYAPPSKKFLSILIKSLAALNYAAQSQAFAVQGRHKEAAGFFDKAISSCCAAFLQACNLEGQRKEITMHLLPLFSLLKQIQSSDQRIFTLYTNNSVQYLDEGDSVSGDQELHFFINDKEYAVGLESGFLGDQEI